MATGDGVHTVAATATKRIEFCSSFRCRCRCRRSVNGPLTLMKGGILSRIESYIEIEDGILLISVCQGCGRC